MPKNLDGRSRGPPHDIIADCSICSCPLTGVSEHIVAMDRDAELTLRLVNLIDALAEETGLAEPEAEHRAPETWTEAQVRAFFRSGGSALPTRLPSASCVIAGQPGGGRAVNADKTPEPPAPVHIERARIEATSAIYRASAFANGIPDRPRGLFPPDDPVLSAIVAEPGAYRPLFKNMIGLNGTFEVVHQSWAASEGLDMR